MASVVRTALRRPDTGLPKPSLVTPAKAGVQEARTAHAALDSGFRLNNTIPPND
jgi:hypothetical protein